MREREGPVNVNYVWSLVSLCVLNVANLNKNGWNPANCIFLSSLVHSGPFSSFHVILLFLSLFSSFFINLLRPYVNHVLSSAVLSSSVSTNTKLHEFFLIQQLVFGWLRFGLCSWRRLTGCNEKDAIFHNASLAVVMRLFVFMRLECVWTINMFAGSWMDEVKLEEMNAFVE